MLGVKVMGVKWLIVLGRSFDFVDVLRRTAVGYGGLYDLGSRFKILVPFVLVYSMD